eukprot:GHUV01025167.1.p1 GENE.GHUV01025167.1~~GHUV01025167.1.p1  ORF type:complete len:324 (-),score=134.45 GHUV01025167.1:270-1241(-)
MDQSQGPPSSKLQPTSVMAAAAAALGAGGALGKAAAKAVGIPLNARSGSNNALCNGEYSDTAQHAGYNQGMPAAAMGAGGLPQGWQMDPAMGVPAGAHTLHGAPSNDLILSGTDVTPRQLLPINTGMPSANAAMQGGLSAAAPLVTSNAVHRLSTGSGYTPRAMETDAPGLAGKQGGYSSGGAKQLAAGVLTLGPQAGALPQQQLPNSARDGNGQAAMMAAIQATMAAAPPGSTPSYMSTGDISWGEQHQQQHDVPQSGSLTNRSMATAGALAHAAGNASQALHRQLIQQQQDGLAGMAIVGQGIGPSSSQPHGSGVLPHMLR